MPRPPVAVVALILVLASACAPEGTEGTAEPTTMPSTTTVTTTTTTGSEAAVSAALQEIFADLTEQDCAEEVLGFRDYALVMADTVTAIQNNIDAGLLLEAELNYWQIWGQTTIALDDYALWMEVCAPKSSPELVAEVESFTPTVQEAWDELEASCLAELQAHGWTCTPA